VIRTGDRPCAFTTNHVRRSCELVVDAPAWPVPAIVARSLSLALLVAVRIRRITITVNPCTHGHRAWVALWARGGEELTDLRGVLNDVRLEVAERPSPR
jgi:hypothetical protein